MSERNHSGSGRGARNEGQATKPRNEGDGEEGAESERTQSNRWSSLEEATKDQRFDLRGYAHVVAQYPLASLVAGFSVGFGLGVLATAILSRREEGWWERQHFGESLHGLSTELRQIPGRVAQHLPDIRVMR